MIGTYSFAGVARVLSIFSGKEDCNLPPCLLSPLLLVEYFTLVSRPEDDHAGVGMYRVQRPPSNTTSNYLPLYCSIVSLTSVLYSLELIPVYATKLLNAQVSSATCLDAYKQYYINCFADKDTYHVSS